MYRACIAVIDASRARLFTFERTNDGGRTHERTSEHVDLVNPARRLRPGELFSETRPGLSRTGGLQFAFDDHREDHLDDLDEKFAREVIASIGRLIDDTGAQRLIVCASPKMLGMLRAASAKLSHRHIEVDELARDFARLSTAVIIDRLERRGLLPPRP